MENAIFVHEIKLTGESTFAEKFNYVSELFQKWRETQNDADWDAYWQAKYRLESGY